MRIDKMSFKFKPVTQNETTGVSIRLSNSPDRDYTLEELKNYISNGRSILLEVMKGSRKQDNFVKTKYIGIDIDSENANFIGTSDKLKEVGIDFYLRYKSFSYTDEHQKHRYILKFDDYLNKEESLIVYNYLSSLDLELDNSTTNLCRIWYGTNHKISNEDAPGLEINKEWFFENVDSKFKKVDLNSIVEYESKYDNIWITNLNEDLLYDTIVEEIEQWRLGDRDYDSIRRGIYSALMITDNILDTTHVDTFIDMLDSTRKKKWKEYRDYDKIHGKFKYTNGLDMINEFAEVVDVDSSEVFDILKNVDFIDKSKDEFITTDEVLEISKGTNLLCASAGLGKTTAIINTALLNDGTYRVMIVPTIAIAEQLEYKFGDYPIEFLYSGKTNEIAKDIIDGINMTVATYDSYYYGLKSDRFPEHTLYIDEAHELISFHSIGSKGYIITHILDTLPKNNIWVTATPFNLADIFKKKVFYRKNTNKKPKVIVTNKVRNTVLRELTNQNYNKVLVYVNSKSKIDNYLSYLIKDDDFEESDISIIHSGSRNDVYQCLVQNEDFDEKIVFTTKFLNIGFDIQGQFDTIIYADDKVYYNDLLQFLNRERQTSNFTLVTNNVMKLGLTNVNTKYKKTKDKLKSLSNHDKELLDINRVNGDINPHLLTDKEFYPKVAMPLVFIQDLFEKFYTNWNVEIYYDYFEDGLKFDKKSTMIGFESFVREELGYYLDTFINGEPIDWDLYPYLNSTAIRKIYRAMNYIGKNFIELDARDLIDHDGDKFVLKLTVKELFNISSTKRIDKFENTKIKGLLTDIYYRDILTPKQRDGLITKLNYNKVFLDNKAFNEINFTRNLARLGIFFEKVRKDKQVNGERFKIVYYENVTWDVTRKSFIEMERVRKKEEKD